MLRGLEVEAKPLTPKGPCLAVTAQCQSDFVLNIPLQQIGCCGVIRFSDSQRHAEYAPVKILLYVSLRTTLTIWEISGKVPAILHFDANRYIFTLMLMVL